jgi:ABC-type Zn uptake system ZnuABC Zn-binding protein ZnuA
MRTWIVIAAALLPVLGGCDASPPPRRPGPPRIVVSVAPLTGLVEELAPAGAEVRTLVPPGQSLHGFEMTPGDVSALGSADLVVYVGLGLDPQTDSFLREHPSAERREVCFARVAGVLPGSTTAPEDHDHHSGPDPHLWLDPALVQTLVVELTGTMRDLPGTAPDEEALTRREAALLEKIAQVDKDYNDALAPFAGAAIITHHNAFSRLAARYGRTIAAVIRPIESEEPTPGDGAAAIDAVRKSGARAVFVEPQFGAAGAEALAEQVGVPVGTLDPEGRTDWFELMRRNLAELVRVLASPDR